MKRKFEFEDASPVNCKQQKLVPFPHYGSDDDSDSMMTEAEPFFSHTRISSNASSTSSDTSSSPTTSPYIYPTFDIYPMPDDPMMQTDDFASAPQNSPSPVGLLQPHSSFKHHGSNCSQIPKLRIACAPGLNGQRTMWSFCEQCGAISMVSQD